MEMQDTIQIPIQLLFIILTYANQREMSSNELSQKILTYTIDQNLKQDCDTKCLQYWLRNNNNNNKCRDFFFKE